MQKVGVQHSDFTEVTQPDLWRGLPKAFPDLEWTHKQTQGVSRLKNNEERTERELSIAIFGQQKEFRCNLTYDSLVAGGN